MKDAVKRAVANGPSLPFWRRPRRVILCYHGVHPFLPHAEVTPTVFAQQMSWLAEHAEVVSLHELLSSSQVSSEKPRVALTFDDGWADVLTHASPVLREHAFPATAFITTGFVARDPSVIHRLTSYTGNENNSELALSWDDVEHLVEGNFSVGAHTVTHRNLALLSNSEQMQELQRSREDLAAHLSVTPMDFAYPFGRPRVHYEASTEREVRSSGFCHAVTLLALPCDAAKSDYAVPRYHAPDSMLGLAAIVAGRLDLLGLWQRHAPLPVLSRVSPKDFSYDT